MVSAILKIAQDESYRHLHLIKIVTSTSCYFKPFKLQDSFINNTSRDDYLLLCMEKVIKEIKKVRLPFCVVVGRLA